MRRLVHVRDNIDDQGPNQLLARAHGDARSIPGSIEILSKLCKVRSRGSCRRRARCLQARQATLHTSQCCFPILLQLRNDQTVIGVAGGVAPLCQRGLILSLLEFEFDDPTLFAQDVHMHLLGLQGRLYRHWFHNSH